MVSAKKLLEKMERLPPDMPLAQVEKVLEYLGWKYDRTSGSHDVYVRNGQHISVPTVGGRDVKRTYLKQIVDNK